MKRLFYRILNKFDYYYDLSKALNQNVRYGNSGCIYAWNKQHAKRKVKRLYPGYDTYKVSKL